MEKFLLYKFMATGKNIISNRQDSKMANLPESSTFVKIRDKKENTELIKSPKKINRKIQFAAIFTLSLSLSGLCTSILAIFDIVSHPLFSGHFGLWLLLNLGPLIFIAGNWFDKRELSKKQKKFDKNFKYRFSAASAAFFFFNLIYG